MREAVGVPVDERLPNPVCKPQDLQLALAKYCEKFLQLSDDQDGEKILQNTEFSVSISQDA